MRPMPLYMQVLLGAGLGAMLGAICQQAGISTENLGLLGMLVIRLLKALAAPLILVAIVDAFVRTHITARQGLRLATICLINVSVACSIGLTLMNLFRPGDHVRGELQSYLGQVPSAQLRKAPEGTTLDPIHNIAGYVPESLIEPLRTNNVISIVIAGILFGAALRAVRNRNPEDPGVRTLEGLAGALFQLLIQVLEWVVRLVPLAVLATTADAVGRAGLSVFKLLGPFLAVILFGLAVHALLYYPLAAWVVGGKTPREFLSGSADAAITGLSCNSSLATVPVTLRVLTQKLGVSEASARLSACVGTNLNNDGITLYEAMAALFLAQAMGPPDLSLMQQLGIVGASIMAGVGVAGVPEAGLIVLPLVLGAAGLSEATVASVIPLILPVDWIIARCRSGVNVLSDILVAVMLDGAARRVNEPPVDTADLTLPPVIHEGQIEQLT